MGTFVYCGLLAITSILFENGYQIGYQRALMTGEKLLTEMQCRGAKASNKVRYLNDGGGLRLRVRPNVSRHWIYRYRLKKKEKNTSLGTYHIPIC